MSDEKGDLRTIWKFPLSPGENNLMMNRHATVLHIEAQRVESEKLFGVTQHDQQIQMWAMVSPGNGFVNRKIVGRGTGHPLKSGEDAGTYIATVQSGPFVWHFFDLGETELH
ncbi:MAG: hypothetical protein E6R03_11640 [Hyphomicrobiaceae bacterium]|nr:MAG: hypothetical protein E6R03_11640 [Hyphomicrobiaceae bacterium]